MNNSAEIVYVFALSQRSDDLDRIYRINKIEMKCCTLIVIL